MCTTMADDRPVVFCSWGFPEAGISLLREHFKVHVWDGPDGAPREVLLRELADGAAAVLALPPSDRLDLEAMSLAINLKVISGFGVGFDYVDVAEATKRGIAVCNTPGILTEATADQVWALLLGMARNVPKGDRYVRAIGSGITRDSCSAPKSTVQLWGSLAWARSGRRWHDVRKDSE